MVASPVCRSTVLRYGRNVIERLKPCLPQIGTQNAMHFGRGASHVSACVNCVKFVSYGMTRKNDRMVVGGEGKCLIILIIIF